MDAMRRYLISIDGGGTKTDISVSDRLTGNTRRIPCGGGNFKTHGIETVRGNLRAGLQAVFEGRPVSESVLYTVAGIAGCDSEADRAVYENILTEFGIPQERLLVCNDSEMIFRSLSSEPGLCLIAGTGSIVFGFSADGSVFRSGGWGAPVSDEGSGYWIGARMIDLYLRWIDGLGEDDPFFANFRNRYPESSPDEIAAKLAQLSPVETAGYAKMILESAEESKSCRGIIITAGEKIADLAYAVFRKCGFPKGIPLTVIESGSLFKNEAFEKSVQESIVSRLPKAVFHFRKAEGIPADNGIRLAGMLADKLESTQPCESKAENHSNIYQGVN